MEQYAIADIRICFFSHNCSILAGNSDNGSSGVKFGNSFESRLSDWEDLIVASYLSIVGIIAMFINGLVMYVCIRKKKTLASMDYYILNLAIIDIFMPVVGFPFPIHSSINHKWIVGDFLCASYGFLGFFCGVVSITTLTAISFARYLKVCGVRHADSVLKNTKYTILGIYLYAGLWAFLPVFGIGAYGPEPYGTSCTLAWQNHEVFVTFFLIACVILPVIVMNVSYGKMLFHIRRSSQRSRSAVCRSQTTSSKKRDSYLIKMTFTMCVGFVGLWSPYAIVSLWTAYGRKNEVPVRLTLCAVLLAKLSTIVNPLIYFMLNKKFRPILKKYFSRIYTRLSCMS